MVWEIEKIDVGVGVGWWKEGNQQAVNQTVCSISAALQQDHQQLLQ